MAGMRLGGARALVVMVALFVGGVPAPVGSREAQPQKLPRLSRATLLMGHPPQDLVATTGGQTTQLQMSDRGWIVRPSISPDGRFIASARTDSHLKGSRLAVGIYSTADDKWTDYKDLTVFDGAVAISPDGTKLACITRSRSGALSQMSVVDLKSGRVTVAPDSENTVFGITWSPDGRRIAFERGFPNPVTADMMDRSKRIYIFDLEKEVTTKLTDGAVPSWSPSGEWIAFQGARTGHSAVEKGLYDKDIDSLKIIRPDGRDARTLTTFHSAVSGMAPVWSPDSHVLLINMWRDENAMDIYQMDLRTMRFREMFRNTPPVYAWVAAR